jgi:hypothetical protein
VSDETPQRRALDVDPAVQLFVRDEVAETRHKLINEIAALGTKVDLFMAQSTKEHAEVAGKLDRLTDDVAGLKQQQSLLGPEVAALKLADATAEAQAVAAERLRAQSRQQFRWLVGLIVAAVPASTAVVALIAH